MPLTATQIGDNFEYAWVPEVGSPTTFYFTFAPQDIDFGPDGSILGGSSTGYTMDISVAGGAGMPDVIPRTTVVLSEGDFQEMAPVTLEQLEFLLPAVLIGYGQMIAPLGETGQTFVPVVISALEGVRYSGTQESEVFDLYNKGTVVLARGGDDYVTTGHADGVNYINLGGGNDIFKGSASPDSDYAGDGSRIYTPGSAEARVWGGKGDDTMTGGTAGDRLIGGLGDDDLEGGEGHDLMRGGQDDDFLRGGQGDDSLSAGEGADVLIANGGDDKLWGGAGRDAFVFNLDPFNTSMEAGVNQIRDFDVTQDFLWITNGYNGNDFDAQDGYDAFMAGASQRAWGVLFKADDYAITLAGVSLDDLSVDHFVEELLANGSDFGWASWPQIDTDTWTLIA